SNPRARPPRSPAYSAASSVSSSTTCPVGRPRTPASWAAGTGSSTTMSTASIAARCSCGMTSSGTGSYSGIVASLILGLLLLRRVVVVGDGDLPLLAAGPPDGELPERLRLVEGDGPLPEQLEQGEEPGDDDGGGRGVGSEGAERRGAGAAEAVDEHRRLLAHRDHGGVQVPEVDLRRPGPGGERRGGELGEPFRAHPDDELGQQGGEVRLEGHRTRVGARARGPPALEVGGDLLVRPVLEQPGEEQVARLEQLEVLLVLDRAAREQPGGLEVEERRRDNEELARLPEVPVLLAREVGDELVGHLREGHLGDVELVLRDEREQEVERAGEVLQRHREGRTAGLRGGAVGRLGGWGRRRVRRRHRGRRAHGPASGRPRPRRGWARSS